MDQYLSQRKSNTVLGRIYFWTATIHNWYHLLNPPENKRLLIQELKKLSEGGYISVFGFVIMPSHVHMIFRQNKLNGKENPKSSFLKATAHELLKKLKSEGRDEAYKVEAANKQYEIWKRDSLGIEIYSREIAMQKLNYIHFNPVSGKWKLSENDLDYNFSSARFYESHIDEFGFLENIYEYFDD